MTPKIHATFNVYNEAQFIEQAVRSVAELCDRIVLVDGAFFGFPTTSPRSTDGTVEIAEKAATEEGIEFVAAKMSDHTKGYEKIEKILSLVPDGDYMLRMNGDEEFFTAKHINSLRRTVFHNNLPLYTIKMFSIEKPSVGYWLPRIVKKTETLKLTSRHLIQTNILKPPYSMFGPYGKVLPLRANLKDCFLMHYRSKRTPERQKQNEIWLHYYYEHQFNEGII